MLYDYPIYSSIIIFPFLKKLLCCHSNQEGTSCMTFVSKGYNFQIIFSLYLFLQCSAVLSLYIKQLVYSFCVRATTLFFVICLVYTIIYCISGFLTSNSQICRHKIHYRLYVTNQQEIATNIAWAVAHFVLTTQGCCMHTTSAL